MTGVGASMGANGELAGEGKEGERRDEAGGAAWGAREAGVPRGGL
jgi:hypothetical protein